MRIETECRRGRRAARAAGCRAGDVRAGRQHVALVMLGRISEQTPRVGVDDGMRPRGECEVEDAGLRDGGANPGRVGDPGRIRSGSVGARRQPRARAVLPPSVRRRRRARDRAAPPSSARRSTPAATSRRVPGHPPPTPTRVGTRDSTRRGRARRGRGRDRYMSERSYWRLPVAAVNDDDRPQTGPVPDGRKSSPELARVGAVGVRRAGHAPGRIRTCGLALRRRALYPLSYGRGRTQCIRAVPPCRSES